MNILVIPSTYGFLKPKSGGQSRFYNLTCQLQKQCNDIILLESKEFYDKADLKRKKKFIKKSYYYSNLKLRKRNLFLFRDLNLKFFSSIWKILKNEEIDLIQISHPSGALFLKVSKILLRKKFLVVYDAHNVESEFIKNTFDSKSEINKLEKFLVSSYIKLLEKITFKHVFDHTICVSENEKKFFIENYNVKEKNLTVIPSGCHLFKKQKVSKKDVGISNEKFIVFFHGLYSHPPNKEAFHLIENRISNFFLDKKNILFLVGGTGTLKIQKRNFKSVGFINDLHKILSIVDMAIVPLNKGAGTKLKVLDYLSAGIPMVTTEKGVEGLEIKNKEHALVVNSVNEEFIEGMELLIENKELRTEIGQNARNLASDLYDWDKIGIRLSRVYGSLKNDNK